MFFDKSSTGILLIAAILFTFICVGSLYLRFFKSGGVFFIVTALLWTVFAEEVRLEKCQARCPQKK